MLGIKALAIAAVSLALSVEARRKSYIQLIGDGFGPASETMARDFMQARDHKSWDTTLALDDILVGQLRTRSTDSLVTDSAASATAYSCGVKSINGYIGVDIDQKPCGTVLEGAKAADWLTALVTTTRVTHATPASFSAHINDRDLENEIAVQQIGDYSLGRQVDLLWGGGLRHFISKGSDISKREDDRDLLQEARDGGWHVALDRESFDNFKNGSNVELPSLGLFAVSHMSYEIDRNPKEQPSLKEMSIAALNALKKEDKPFFIMIEGGRIDHAGHNNDPIGHVYDILEYNKVIAAVRKWIDENGSDDDEYIMVSTADHECGGLALAWQRPEDSEGLYNWFPDVLFNANHTTEYLSEFYLNKTKDMSDDKKKEFMRETIIKEQLGVYDVQDNEVDQAIKVSQIDDEGLSLTIWLGTILNWRAHISWSSTGHSAVDVNLYYYSNNKDDSILQEIRGNHENTWIGEYIAKYGGFDLASITKKLNNGTDHQAGWGSRNHSTPTGEYHSGTKRVIPQTPALDKRGNEVFYSHLDNTMFLRRWTA
ncbi:alkaline phosphatase [Malassezia cuniculi]|uniref:Alkaline phosphatase n=1 Tax=Malassezia cuniculi TaxID=948313 RepID=A0AAF0J5U4_9BASI|nr:alkaline phosphatase [Malassezia cuniculi]